MLMKSAYMGSECCEILFWSSDVRKAVLDQRPTALMVESSTPAYAAAVAAPIQKLCPAYRDWSIPMWPNTSQRAMTNHLFVRGLPSRKWKKGPCVGPRIVMYELLLGTWGILHTPGIYICHSQTVDILRIQMDPWYLWLLYTIHTNILPCICGWNAECIGTVIFPVRRNPKKEIKNAAHSTTVFLSTIPAIVLYITKRVFANMRRWGFFGEPCPILCLATPFNMSLNHGQDDSDFCSGAKPTVALKNIIQDGDVQSSLGSTRISRAIRGSSMGSCACKELWEKGYNVVTRHVIS